MENFTVNNHASICIDNKFYIDPFKIEGEPHNAKIVFITHSHYDHLSIEDIKKVSNEKTHFIAPRDCMDKLFESGFIKNGKDSNFTVFKANSESNKRAWFYFDDYNMKCDCFPAYNIDKWRDENALFHPKESGGLGYIIVINDKTYVICGDTDFTKELGTIKDMDVLFVPIGGTYTMTAKEAANCVNKLRPKCAVPVHYNSIVGDKDDEKVFLKNLDKNIDYKIFL